MGEIYSFATHRRLRSLEVEPSPDELTQEERVRLWVRLERLDRAAENIRRILKLLPPERGLYESEGQMPLMDVVEGDEQSSLD